MSGPISGGLGGSCVPVRAPVTTHIITGGGAFLAAGLPIQPLSRGEPHFAYGLIGRSPRGHVVRPDERYPDVCTRPTTNRSSSIKPRGRTGDEAAVPLWTFGPLLTTSFGAEATVP